MKTAFFKSTNRSNNTFKVTEKRIYCRYLLRDGRIKESKIPYEEKSFQYFKENYCLIDCDNLTFLTADNDNLKKLL